MNKSVKIIKLEIDENDFYSGVDGIALVEEPAIEENFIMFSKQNKELFESYNDYPDSVSNNAKRGIELNEKQGNKCATQVGKVRAQQLANKENVSVETIKRMYSYLSRAEEYYDEGDTTSCGYISYMLWGGLSAKRWAESKLKELDLFEGSIDVSGLAPYVNEPSGSLIVKDVFVENAGGFSVGDYVSWTFAGRGDDADRGRGQITDLRVQGEVNVPQTDVTLTATEEDPVALIRTRSGKVVGQYTRNLRQIQKPEGFVDPRAGENEDEFISRCMSSLEGEFPDQDQRLAVCYSSWEDRFEQEHIAEYFDRLFDLLGFLDGLPVFATPEEASEVAMIAGCEGYHEHPMGDMVVYMPCQEHEPEWDELLQEAYKEWIKSKRKSWDDLTEGQREELLDYLQSVGEEDVVFSQDTFAVSSADAKPNEDSIKDSGTTRIRYKYSVRPGKGSSVQSNTRDFCRDLIGLNLLYRKEDINSMSLRGANPGLGPGGSNSYDIFQFAGGNNCRHYWEEVRQVYNPKTKKWGRGTIRVEEANTQDTKSTISLLGGTTFGPRAIGESFSKFSEEQRLIAGPLMVPDKMIYRVDEFGNDYYVYFSSDTIKKIAYKYQIEKRQDTTNIEHDEEQTYNDVVLVETWLVSDPNNDKSKALMGKEYPKGTWMGVMKVNNDQIWTDYVKTGLVKGFSVEGYFADKLINERK